MDVEVFMIQRDHVNVRPLVALMMIAVLTTILFAEEEATPPVSRVNTAQAAPLMRSVSSTVSVYPEFCLFELAPADLELKPTNPSRGKPQVNP